MMANRHRLSQLIKCPFSGIARRIRLLGLALAFALVSSVFANTIAAQQTIERIMDQDSTLNNLVDPVGYETAELETLGNVIKTGSGSKQMILIPGLGFGGEIFTDFMAAQTEEYSMYAVTLAGFGGTKAPPSPAVSVSFGEQSWTNNALKAIEKLVEDEGIDNVIIVGHWLTGTQLGLRYALNHPEKTQAVILISGSACFIASDTIKYPPHPPLSKRVGGVDHYFAPRWFKTVTRETWDDNNFIPGDYAYNPILGLRLWREAARPQLHVWIRYLCEFFAQDVSLELEKLTTPVLLLKPGFEDLFYEHGNNYMYNYCHISWEASVYKHNNIEVETVPQTRVCMWLDDPEAVNSRIANFLKRRSRK